MDDFAEGISQLSLLYVEDEPVTRDAVCSLIRRKFGNIRIHTAGNGAEGLERYRECRPDIVITDIRMPVMSGIEMAKSIRALNGNTRIIITTAHGDLDYLIEAIEIGINRYVMKPIDKEMLFAALEKSIAGILMERRLLKQREFIQKLTRAVEQGPSMVVITDTNGTIEYVNPKYTEVTGYSLQELIGHPSRLVDAKEIPPEVYERLWCTIEAGRDWHGELQSMKKDGKPFWESVSISPILDTNGAITHYVEVREDISERKQAESEIKALNANLAAHSLELEAANRDLESFSYTVSHDLRKPLTVINGYCQLLLELCGGVLTEQCRGFLDEMYEETLSMNKLIDTLLNFSRLARKEIEREMVDLSEIVCGIATTFRVREPERRVTFTITEGITASGDANLVRVVLDNLIGNAWKYTGGREEAHIEFGVTDNGGNPAYFVRDNGIGFAMVHADKIFTAFQRLHAGSEFKGIGIGLATVQRIIQRHGGSVWAEGEEEKGAIFYFTLS